MYLCGLCPVSIGNVQGQSWRVISFLEYHKADLIPDTRNARGVKTPLSMAVTGQHDLIVKDVLANKAVDVDAI
jgi:hypothetical protein